MAKVKEWRGASSNPDDMVQTGLWGGGDGFYGRVTYSRYGLWDFKGAEYEGKRVGFSVVLHVKYLSDDGDEFEDHIPVGSVYTKAGEMILAPSQDNASPHPDLPEDLDDLIGDEEAQHSFDSPYVASLYGSLPKKSSYDDYAVAAKTAGYPSDRFTNDIRHFEGTYGHWIRLPRASKPTKDLVVLNEFKGIKKDGGKGGSAKTAEKVTSSKAADPEPEDESPEMSEEFLDEMKELVVSEIANKPKSPAELSIKAIQKYKSDPDPNKKKAATDLLKNEEFQTGNEDLWVMKGGKFTAA